MMHLHGDPFSTLDPLAPKPDPSPLAVPDYDEWREKFHKLRKLEQEQEALLKRLEAVKFERKKILELSPAGHASQKRANKVAERYGFSGAQRTE